MGAFAIGALSMIGLPPAAGFVSKWYILSGAMANAQWLAVAVIVVSTALNAGYLLPIVHRAFFRAPPSEDASHPHGEAPLAIVIALTLTAAGTVALFFAPELPLALARQMLVTP
jgi:multicomponent Na+:H+ antiporter subunit D